MSEDFWIVDTEFVTGGPYISFTVLDGCTKVPARISDTTLAVLDGNYGKGRLWGVVFERDITTIRDVFNEHRERIRETALKVRRASPHREVIEIWSTDL